MRQLSKLEKSNRIKVIKRVYYKEGQSVEKVAKHFNISTGTLYKFMRRYGLERRTTAETNRITYEKQPLSFAVKSCLNVAEQKLKVAGIMLYWAEGAKIKPDRNVCVVDLANSDSRMIGLFLKFLRNICGIDENRLRCFLYCYANQNLEKLKKYWSKLTNISLKQFTKPYVRKDFLERKSGRMKYGLVHVRYSDKKLLILIDKWIKQYIKREV